MKINGAPFLRILQAIKTQPKEMVLMLVGVKNSTAKVGGTQANKLQPNSEMHIKAFVEDYKKNPEMAGKWLSAMADQNKQGADMTREVPPPKAASRIEMHMLNTDMHTKAFVEDYKNNPEMATRWLNTPVQHYKEHGIRPIRPAPLPPMADVQDVRSGLEMAEEKWTDKKQNIQFGNKLSVQLKYAMEDFRQNPDMARSKWINRTSV